MQRKRRRRGEVIDEHKENNEFDEHIEAVPSTSREVIQKVSFANVQQFSPRLTRKTADYFPFKFLPKHVQEIVMGYIPLRNRVQLERLCTDWRYALLNSWRKVHRMSIPSTLTEDMQIRPINDAHVCGLLHKCGRYLEEIDFFIPHLTIGQHVLYSISHLCNSLRKLKIRSDLDGISMTFLMKTYAHIFSELRSLDIYYHNLDSIHNGLRAVSRTLTNVRDFRLECYSLPPNVAALFPNSSFMKSFTIKMKQFAHLPTHLHPSQDTRVCSSFVGDFFSYLSDVYPLLEELEVSILALAIPDEERLRTQLSRFGSQRTIKRMALRLVSSGDWWGSTALRSLSSFRTLNDLSLTACQLPYDLATIFKEAGMTETLRSLRLLIIGNLDGSRLLELFSALPQLRIFSLGYTQEFLSPCSIDAQLFVSMFMVCYRLASLELIECQYVDRAMLARAMHSAFHDTAQFSDALGLPPIVTMRFVCGASTISRRKRGGAKCCSQGIQKVNEYLCTVQRLCSKKTGAHMDQSSSD